MKTLGAPVRNTRRSTPSRIARYVGLGSLIALVTASAPAFAGDAKPAPAPSKPAKGKGKEEKKPATPAEAPQVAKPVAIQPKELAWGIDRKKLGEIYDKVIDEDYKPRYQKAQPGPQTDALDAEVAERKAEFRRSYTEFNDTKTGYDMTALRPEFTYNNKEALMSIERGGRTRYFFFIGGKLWKIVDSFKLGEKSQWGKTYDEALAKLAKHYGEGRVREADAEAGRPYKEADWKDTTTQVRAVDWANNEFAIVFQDSATVANLPTLRKNKESGGGGSIDAKVKDAGRKKDAPPAPPPGSDGKPKK
jgi:hypothetical protein